MTRLDVEKNIGVAMRAMYSSVWRFRPIDLRGWDTMSTQLAMGAGIDQLGSWGRQKSCILRCSVIFCVCAASYESIRPELGATLMQRPA